MNIYPVRPNVGDPAVITPKYGIRLYQQPSPKRYNRNKSNLG